MRRAALLAALWWAATGGATALAQQAETPLGEARRPLVTLDLGAEEAYESNVPYTQFEGQDDYVSRGTGRLAVVLPIRRGAVELGAEGGANVYRTVKGLDRFTWGGFAGLEHRISRRSDLTARGRTSRGYARDNPLLVVNGSLAPLTLMRSDVGEAEWRQRLTKALELRLDGHGERFQFDSPQLQDGWTAGGRLRLENAFGARAAAGVEASYARTATTPNPALAEPGVEPRPGVTIDVETLAATVRISLIRAPLQQPGQHLRGLELQLEGGAARFGPAGSTATTAGVTAPAETTAPTPAAPDGPPRPEIVPQETTVTPTLAATLTGTVGRHTVAAVASRRVEQTYGAGAIGINRSFSLEYRYELTRWSSFRLNGAENHNEAANGFLLSSGRTLTAGFTLGLPADFSARLDYSYWDRQDPERDWRSHTVQLGLAKRFAWR